MYLSSYIHARFLTSFLFALIKVNEDPGSGASSTTEEDSTTNNLFIAVGTGVVDKDGEDVSSKGRVLLFRVNRQSSASLAFGSTVADLSLVYEKDILHGAVTSLSCLVCEGRNRIVVGAGADINVEQWGNGRLTQVGFFRANMQILDILLFKTFFLLSDA
jgi:cleavage and polyadenylation specificity factor subunit 1